MNILPIFKTLQASPDVVALVNNRIYEDIAPNGTKFPYVIWSLVGGVPNHNLDCPPKIDHLTYQLVVYDIERARASEIRKAISVVLDPLCTITNLHPNHVERVADTNIFGRGFDANWWFDR
ncbi:DUF3168 domain-containing protein [Acinetobacter guillouiae]|uniref:DUF3168 domain-containing protein n=1 Tax=Acinetobacter guillouiae TaxID=106649 RepID=UPI0026E12F91|nr:DUF3168 domain-containing protein [Acinetobacter guillouiae]MDO6646190.1 DUF3168 domain-containing protein [Acinetobacter guillouiae]